MPSVVGRRYRCLTSVMAIHLTFLFGGLVPGCVSVYGAPRITSANEVDLPSSSILSSSQQPAPKIQNPMMFRYCTDATPDDCSDFMSENGQCVNLTYEVTSGSFLVLYPSKKCYLYNQMNCKGEGKYEFEPRWYLANQNSPVGSYRCFK